MGIMVLIQNLPVLVLLEIRPSLSDCIVPKNMSNLLQ
jgi:hypothetical protein